MTLRIRNYALAALLLSTSLFAFAAEAPKDTPPTSAPSDAETAPDVLRKVSKLLKATLNEKEEERTKGWTGFKDMGNLAVPGLLGFYRQKTTTPEMMCSILIALEDSKDPRAGPALVEILGSENRLVRRNAARAIGDVLYKEGKDAVSKVACDLKEDEEVRLFAAAAGAKLGSAPCSEALALLAQSPKPEIRSRAIFALGKAGGTGQLAAFNKALSDADVSVREDAVLALGLIGADETLPMLVKALEDEDRHVRGAAMDALRKQTKQKIDNDLDAWKKWWQEKKPTKPADSAKKSEPKKESEK